MIRVVHYLSIFVVSVFMMGIWVSSLVLAAPPAIEPCKIVTIAEVEQIIGKLKEAPKSGQEGEAAWCNYEFANGKDAFEIWVFPASGIDRARKLAKKPVQLKGLGDDAFMNRGMHGLDYVDIFIKKGSATVKLSLHETAGDEDKLKALAQKAVGRF
ncbi:protein of unknown function [Nitrospira japonica]|uniref:Uncharacterized protein n=1 Tax=Nitrospira japonica TaxID=1325564 RepID=A0A1W1I869_9BACT|nr:hypothetical protein [Nitrospira japonica]SLM49196.1 protein of unknown function [Nitrospira japonica]